MVALTARAASGSLWWQFPRRPQPAAANGPYITTSVDKLQQERRRRIIGGYFKFSVDTNAVVTLQVLFTKLCDGFIQQSLKCNLISSLHLWNTNQWFMSYTLVF